MAPNRPMLAMRVESEIRGGAEHFSRGFRASWISCRSCTQAAVRQVSSQQP